MRRFCQVWSAAILMVAAVRGAGAAESPRQDISLDDNWSFVRQEAPGADRAAFAEKQWTTVTLPHTWNNQDGADGGGYYRGPGWYRKHVKLDPSLKGKSLFLKFDGAAIVTDVYVNGQDAGRHAGGWGAFCFDVTPMLNFTDKKGDPADNVIAVRVDNARHQDVPSLGGDFTIYGGLYRDVHLLALEPVSVSPLDDASSGVYLKQDHVTADAADVEVTTKLRNDTLNNADVTVDCVVTDAAGATVAHATAQQNLTARGVADAVEKLTIAHPHLWNGREDPYLYRATVEVKQGGKVVDRVTQPLGLRFFRVDPNEGFFLNGRRYHVHGVNRHQDRRDVGWAITDAQQDEDYAMMAEMGCTGVRLAHYQQAQHIYDLCDKGGMIVWGEYSMVNEVHDTPGFRESARQQLGEFIKQSYNHPSICFWSLFNELSFHHGWPAETAGTPGRHTWDVVGDLNQLAHQLDPTRPTTGATYRGPTLDPADEITDTIGVNKYFGWYVPKLYSWAGELDALHQKNPGRCVAISEYGAGASVYQHELEPKHPTPGSHWHPEEWQCVVHEVAYGEMKKRPWLWGTFLWCMFDFGSDGRNEGDHAGINDKGVVTYDRKIKKDAFYFYQANWTTEPMVHVNSRRYTPRAEATAPVKVYSNCKSVELKVNGQSLGAKENADHIFVWDAVTLKTGENTIEAVGDAGGKTARDSCVIVVDPTATTHPADPPQK